MPHQVAATSTGTRTWRCRRVSRSIDDFGIRWGSVDEKGVARIYWLAANAPNVVDQGRIDGVDAAVIRFIQTARSLTNGFLRAPKQQRGAANECSGTKDCPIAPRPSRVPKLHGNRLIDSPGVVRREWWTIDGIPLGCCTRQLGEGCRFVVGRDLNHDRGFSIGVYPRDDDWMVPGMRIVRNHIVDPLRRMLHAVDETSGNAQAYEGCRHSQNEPT